MVKNLITDEMILKFNISMMVDGSSIRLLKDDSLKCIDIQLPKDKYTKHIDISLTEEFYKKLERFFIQQGVDKLSYNNTCLTFWSYSEE